MRKKNMQKEKKALNTPTTMRNIVSSITMIFKVVSHNPVACKGFFTLITSVCKKSTSLNHSSDVPKRCVWRYETIHKKTETTMVVCSVVSLRRDENFTSVAKIRK